ncbi:predicted protein [Naegleria gruberi]|uniref:Predicted protein n=1 Tax=Naegleria gruberi TaxID=5762 RepID=D2V3E9_NAEGR|nr:uncharacterized protein NAEGRDRAFT_63333 [Naegleria gruberi]EFC48625.1 predicted protein [Naegleria gruberi]|eukprot:XP_002681369.1 predicted protein [Naegleria gruberi strain NEG-M]
MDVNDLSDVAGSLTEYTFDIIYVECFVQLTSIISNWFYLLLLIIPGFAIFKLYNSIIKPYLSMNKAQQEYANSQQQPEMSDKKKKKMERLEKKNQQNMQRMRIRPNSNDDE